MMIEAEWRIDQYVPTIEEYTKIAAVSISSGPVVLPALYLVGQKLSKWTVKDQEYSELLRLTATCSRLLNDIQGLEVFGPLYEKMSILYTCIETMIACSD
jgi:ent-kaurene synthase